MILSANLHTKILNYELKFSAFPVAVQTQSDSVIINIISSLEYMHHNHYSRNSSKNLTYSKSCKTCLKCKECILPGTGGDTLAYHNGMKFTTYDRDNDKAGGSNCAVVFKGAWWYNNSYLSNLNGLYLGAADRSYKGICWNIWKGARSMKKAEMKIRPTGF